MVEPSLSAKAGARRYVTFVTSGRRYAVEAGEVAEIIRTPTAARVPLAPPALIGLAVVRGEVLPLVSLRRLLGLDESRGVGSRAIVLGGASPAALTVDAVEALITVAGERVAAAEAELSAEPGEKLSGAFLLQDEQSVKILDVQALLAGAFVRNDAHKRQGAARIVKREAAHEVQSASKAEKLLTFEVAEQEYALALSDVEEILPAPKAATPIPRAEALVIGVMNHRDQLLPLLSLRGLLGFPPAKSVDGREKVIVTAVRSVQVGLVVDRAVEILSAEQGSLEAVPAVLAARSGGEARLKAIYRGESGRRIVAILSPDQFFGEDVMKRLDQICPSSTPELGAAPAPERQFVVFQLGGDEFGLPVEAVDEVARVPEKITRVPKTPAFLEGVVDLRGEVLPIVDQRRRFNMPKSETGKDRRMIVVRTDGRRAGLIVDAVSEVRRVQRMRSSCPPI